MYTETECGICYQTYNLGRRCPRQLSCKHSFCESCLVTLGRSADIYEPRIVCPLCRHFTAMPEPRIKDNLPVDEDIFERLVTAGISEECADDGQDAEEPDQYVPSPPTEDASPTPRTRKAHLMKRLRRLCRTVIGDTRTNCMSDTDLRDLAMMSCYLM